VLRAEHLVLRFHEDDEIVVVDDAVVIQVRGAAQRDGNLCGRRSHRRTHVRDRAGIEASVIGRDPEDREGRRTRDDTCCATLLKSMLDSHAKPIPLRSVRNDRMTTMPRCG
jgi:hypothetical protein